MGLLQANSEKCIKHSSKCIVWMDGKVKCIDVCDGEPLGSVIKKIGCSLKELHESLDISELDFGDLLGPKECPPLELKEVIQLILSNMKIQNTSETEVSEDLKVNVAECFVSALGEVTDIQTYVEYLGSTLCKQAEEIRLLQESLSQQKNQLTQLKDQFEKSIGG